MARTYVAETLAFLSKWGINDALSPMAVYWHAYQAAHAQLQTYAQNINDPALQKQFLTQVVVNREIQRVYPKI